MIVKLQDITIDIPSHVSEITLRQRIEYDLECGDEINEAIEEVLKTEKLPKEESNRLLEEIYIDRAQKTFAFFTGLDIETVYKLQFSEVYTIFETHLKAFIELPNEASEVNSFLIDDKLYWLPEPTVTPSSEYTFNEFITAKEITRNMNSKSSEKLNAIAYLGVIFFRPIDGKFKESDLDESEAKLEFMYNLPLPTAMQIGLFYDTWSTYIQKNFSVFEKSKVKGIDMSTHFDKWGWISFLNYVAKNGTIFYKSNNKSNLENIKEANLYEVLVWGSCEKDQEDIIGKFYEAQAKQNKNS